MPYREKGNAWTWFSIQLENNTEMVCFEYNDGKTKTYLASISYPNNKQKHFSEVEFKPLGKKWKSEKTGTVYPLSWEIKIPKEKIILEVESLVDNQEVNFGTINYWEGALNVKGQIDKKKIKGEGFMELVGYPSDYTKIKFLKDEATWALKNSLSYIKKGKAIVVNDIRKRIKL